MIRYDSIIRRDLRDRARILVDSLAIVRHLVQLLMIREFQVIGYFLSSMCTRGHVPFSKVRIVLSMFRMFDRRCVKHVSKTEVHRNS